MPLSVSVPAGLGACSASVSPHGQNEEGLRSTVLAYMFLFFSVPVS